MREYGRVKRGIGLVAHFLCKTASTFGGGTTKRPWNRYLPSGSEVAILIISLEQDENPKKGKYRRPCRIHGSQ